MELPFRRFFARIIACDVSCPKCAHLIIVGSSRTIRRPRRVANLPFDKLTSIVTCPSCGSRYQLGIIAWRMLRESDAAPIDHIPTPSELAALRQYAGGFMPKARKTRVAPANLILPPCSCAPLPWSAECPVHGTGDPTE